MSQVFGECAIGLLTAAISTRAVAKERNVQGSFREFGSMSNHRTRLTMGSISAEEYFSL
jgi:hypothetical protein